MTTAQAKLTGLGAPGTAPGASLSRLSVRGRALALPITGNRWTDRRATLSDRIAKRGVVDVLIL
jgi:hypothetical protein